MWNLLTLQSICHLKGRLVYLIFRYLFFTDNFIRHEIRTHTDAATSPSIVMYVTLTYSAIEASPKTGSSNSAYKDYGSTVGNARWRFHSSTGSNPMSDMSKCMSYIRSMVVI